MKYVLIALILLAQLLFAQEAPKKKLLSGFYLSFSKQNTNYDDNDLYEYFKNTESSYSLPGEIDKEHIRYFNKANTGSLNFGTCLDISRKMEIRAGLSYIFGDRNSLLVSSEETLRTDTIDNGTELLIYDSVINSHYILYDKLHELAMDMQMLYRSDPDREVTFYIGLGINIGYTLYSNIAYDKTESIEERYIINDKEYYFDVINNNESEYRSLAYNKSLFLRAYVPVGFNVQLYNTGSFVDHLRLNFYVSLGLENQLVKNSSILHEYGAFNLGFSYHI